MTVEGRLAVPTEQCYWGILPAAGAGVATSAARSFSFERVLPVPLESVQIAETKTSDGRWLLVAVDQAYLRTKSAEVGAVSARPAALPEHLAGQPALASMLPRLELLHGPFTPAPLKQLQMTVLVLVLGVLVSVVALLAWREWEAAESIRAQVVALRADSDRLAQSAIAGDPQAVGLPPALALEQAVRRLRLRNAGAGDQIQDISAIAEAVWMAWPQDARLQISQCSITHQRVAIRGLAVDLSTAERLRSALDGRAVPGGLLRDDGLQAQTTNDAVRFSLSLQVVLAPTDDQGAPP